MTDSLVSIIVPAYNAEKNIANTIESVLSQSVNNWELVIIDDGSTDSTPTICDNYANKDYRIRVIHKQNGGVSAARNTGLECTRGQYITFIDSDDFVHPQYIEALSSSIANADICVFKMTSVASVDEVPKVHTSLSICSNTFNLNDAYVSMCEMGVLHPPFSKLYKRSIIDKFGLRFDVEIAMGEDLLFNIDYLDHCQTAIIGQNSIYYYITGNSVLSKTIRQDYGDLQLRFYEVREKFCEKHSINYSLKSRLYSILRDAFGSIAKAPNLTKEVKESSLERIRKSDVTQKYLHETSSLSYSEFIFRLVLKYSIFNFLI